MEKKKFYITTPIYYVNDRPHVGHAYTTLAVDILARHQAFKLGQDKVFFLTGTDEHGVKVAQAAEKQNKTPKEFCDMVSAQFKTAWDNLNIKYNDFIRTTEDRHQKTVKEFLLKLKTQKTPKGNPVIFKDKYEGYYCTGCEAYKKEEDLVDGKCPDHGIKPEFLSEENWYFRLSDYTDILKEKIEKKQMRIYPAQREKEVLSFISQGLENIAISRANVNWGVSVPFDENQTVYVWVDALINYISALGYPDQKKFKDFWPADTQILAKDILKFHCIIWPAMLLANELELPEDFFVHGFFTFDGKKMSKTLGNVVDPNDLVGKYGAEAARYLIISQFIFGQDGDIKTEEFSTKYNADLANGLGNLTSRILSMAEKYCQAKVPNKEFNLDIDLEKIWQDLDQGYTDYKIYENIKLIWNILRLADGYIDETKPWALAKEEKSEELNQVIYNLLEILRHIGWMIRPVLPETSDKILKRLNQDYKADFETIKKIGLLKAGESIEKGQPLFQRIKE